MSKLLEQLRKRRLALGLKQRDMMLRVGMSRQQYQRLESKGNPRLETLELIAEGLNSELVLVPREKLRAVKAVLEHTSSSKNRQQELQEDDHNALVDDPWKGLLDSGD